MEIILLHFHHMDSNCSVHLWCVLPTGSTRSSEMSLDSHSASAFSPSCVQCHIPSASYHGSHPTLPSYCRYPSQQHSTDQHFLSVAHSTGQCHYWVEWRWLFVCSTQHRSVYYNIMFYSAKASSVKVFPERANNSGSTLPRAAHLDCGVIGVSPRIGKVLRHLPTCYQLAVPHAYHPPSPSLPQHISPQLLLTTPMHQL